jgi:O-antigen biosynthesis protein
MAKRNKNRQQKQYQQTSFLPKTLVSIIIPVHRRFDLLAKCLASIPDAFEGIDYDVIIADNKSPKEEKEPIYSELRKIPQFRVFEKSENTGFPRACNFGASKSTSPLIFFLNSDIILSKGSGVKTVALFDDKNVGIAGMKLVFPESVDDVKLRTEIRPSNKIQHVGIAVNVRGETLHVLSGWSADHPRVMKIHDAHMITGAALMVRKPLFIQAGGFFEGYGLGTFEDCDLCLSIRQMGYNIVIDTSTYAIHYTGATSETYNLSYPIQQNIFTFMQRWSDKLIESDWLYW